MGGGRLDEVDDHVFRTSSRINSTFGGNLVDMVRATVMLEVIERGRADRPRRRARRQAARSGCRTSRTRHERVTNARGRGLFCAIDLPDARPATRVVAPPVRRRARVPARLRDPLDPVPAAADRHRRRARRAVAALDRVLTALTA
jgi:4-aminobutyrate aminotransferase-like enzyme